MSKIISSSSAMDLIKSGDVVTIAGFVGTGVPEELLIALENRFLKTKIPTDLTLLFAAAPGDGKARGLNHLAHKNLLRRLIGGHYGLVAKFEARALSGDKYEYC